jgi:hypothetical protein
MKITDGTIITEQNNHPIVIMIPGMNITDEDHRRLLPIPITE